MKIIKQSKNSSCQLDAIPTSLLKESIDALLPTITTILNKSLSSGIVPPCLKHAVIHPLLKKADLDAESFKSYRPVSNLPFLSKILEKVISKRLLEHMDKAGHHEIMQSAYKQYHSTETALVKVQNDILTNLDKKRGVILVLLDLSAAFDTIDHDKLFYQLQHRLGISERALQWFRSYLSGRTQAVSVGSECSRPAELRYGVPQGSVLGPLLYTIYTLPLGDLLRDAGVGYHLYADDTQLYLSFDFIDPLSQSETLDIMQQCVLKIKSWMTGNKLKLNDDKTEVMYISSSYFHKQIVLNDFTIDSTSIAVTKSARNIGIIFDENMTMKEQVTAICKAAHFHLRNIGSIRKSITYEACEKLIHAFVTSRLDCGNALLFGLPDNQHKRLQRMLNIAARILTLTSVYSHITPILKELHWLPIPQRIEYKILLLTFKALHGLAPLYLTNLLTPYRTVERKTRSSEANFLQIPDTRTKTFGDRAFSWAAPTLWNKLPVKLRKMDNLEGFKSAIKTVLFSSAYGNV